VALLVIFQRREIPHMDFRAIVGVVGSTIILGDLRAIAAVDNVVGAARPRALDFEAVQGQRECIAKPLQRNIQRSLRHCPSAGAGGQNGGQYKFLHVSMLQR
jgi:hypothetical protein